MTNLISSTILAHLEKLSLNVFIKSMEEFYITKDNGSSSNNPMQNSGSPGGEEPFDQKAFWLLEYQSIILQFTRYVGLYFLVFVVYVCIQALLFFTILLSKEFSLVNENIRMYLYVFAFACCILFYFCIVVATTIVQKLEKRKEKALKKFGLEKSDVDDEFSIGNAASLVYLIFNTIIFFMFIFNMIFS